MELSDSDIQAAKSRDLVEVAQSYGLKLEKAGKEYKALCPFHSEDTASFTITPSKNLYRCMGCGAGGDSITFVREMQGIGFRQAVMTLNGQSESDTSSKPKKQYKSVKPQQQQETEWEHVFPVPDAAPMPPSAINRKIEGEWVRLPVSKRWAYRDGNGALIGYVVRVDLPPTTDQQGNVKRHKEVLPQIWAVNKATGEASWRWLSFVEPRPIYGLDLLAQNPAAKALVVEGEKACEAARELLSALGVKPSAVVVVAWPGGGKAVAKVDWSPLAGRDVYLWPDADQKPYPENHPKAGELMPEQDQPGYQAMMAVAQAVRETATTIKMIKPPEGVPDGWDLADEFPLGFDLTAHIRTSAFPVAFPETKKDAVSPASEPVQETAPVPASAPEPETKGEAPKLPTSIDDEEYADEQDAVLNDPSLPPLVREMLINKHFICLGYDRERYYFFSSDKQQQVVFTRGEFTEIGLLSLAPLSYWEDWGHPVNANCSEESPPSLAKAKKRVIDALLQASHKKGVFDPSHQRGRGAWIDAGRLVLHTGGHLIVDGEKIAIPEFNKRSRYVYELDKRLPAIGKDALSDDLARSIFDLSMSFRWVRQASGLLLAGWVALAPFGGALQWRPHIWITGGSGTGKTTIANKFVFPLLNGYDLFAQGNSSEAGVRQHMRHDALPVLFDESEQNDGRESSRMQAVLALIRQSSTESQAKTYKGTAGGQSMNFMVRSMFCLSSIQVGIKHQADRERMAVLALRPKRETNDAAGEWKVMSEKIYMLSRDRTIPKRLMRRSLDLLPVTMQNIQVFAEAAARKFGSQRDGDQYGTLLAGAWSLISREPVTMDEAKILIDSYDWDEHTEHIDTDDSKQCLSAILESRLRSGGGVELSVYEVVMVAAERDSGGTGLNTKEADSLLQRYGMRVKDGHLLFANGSESLKRLLANTQYESDVRGYLKRVNGASSMNNKPYRIGANVGKVLGIPLDIALPPDDEQGLSPI